jgi:hypothetical protein
MQRSGVSGLRVLDSEGQSTSIWPAYSAALRARLGHSKSPLTPLRCVRGSEISPLRARLGHSTLRSRLGHTGPFVMWGQPRRPLKPGKESSATEKLRSA